MHISRDYKEEEKTIISKCLNKYFYDFVNRHYSGERVHTPLSVEGD